MLTNLSSRPLTRRLIEALCNFINMSTPPIQTKLFSLGNRIFITGGHSVVAEWLDGGAGYAGSVFQYIPGQNVMDAMVVKLDERILLENGQGDYLVLELRYQNAGWEQEATVHVELCDFIPEDKTWRKRKQGVWVEAAATLRLTEVA